MSAALLDVNVLVALFDPAHPDHDAAHHWFGRQRTRGWATCPTTENGCIRVLSNPAYPTVATTAHEAASRLRIICASVGHEFWAEPVSLLDNSLFRIELIEGHRQITDAYLLGLAVRHGGRLATFDRSIPIRAVIGATAERVELLGRTR